VTWSRKESVDLYMHERAEALSVAATGRRTPGEKKGRQRQSTPNVAERSERKSATRSAKDETSR